MEKKDESAFIYCPNHGTDFYLNGDLKATIEDKHFPDRYFRIWFGDKPLSKALKAQIITNLSGFSIREKNTRNIFRVFFLF